MGGEDVSEWRMDVEVQIVSETDRCVDSAVVATMECAGCSVFEQQCASAVG